MTQLQHHDTAAQQLSLSSLFFLSLQLSSRLSHGGWYAGFKAIMTFLLWNTSDMSCYGNIQYQLHICTYQKHSRDCLFSHSSSSYLFLFPQSAVYTLTSFAGSFAENRIIKHAYSHRLAFTESDSNCSCKPLGALFKLTLWQPMVSALLNKISCTQDLHF